MKNLVQLIISSDHSKFYQLGKMNFLVFYFFILNHYRYFHFTKLVQDIGFQLFFCRAKSVIILMKLLIATNTANHLKILYYIIGGKSL